MDKNEPTQKKFYELLSGKICIFFDNFFQNDQNSQENSMLRFDQSQFLVACSKYNISCYILGGRQYYNPVLQPWVKSSTNFLDIPFETVDAFKAHMQQEL